MFDMKKMKLNDGHEIPVIGFGTYGLSGDVAYRSILKALEAGYRHIDTADRYGNHNEVARAIKDSDIRRNDIFLTTKIRRIDLKHNDVLNALERFLEELSTDYLDLLLIHWPNREIHIAETFPALERLKESGTIRSYGVSNFTVNHLNDVLDEGFMPVIDQVEFHPSLSQPLLEEFCDDHSIKITAYSPLAQGRDIKDPVIVELGEKYGKPASKIILNWLISKKLIILPRSSNPEHIKENLDIFNWSLEEDDIGKIDELDRNNRIIDPPFSEFNY